MARPGRDEVTDELADVNAAVRRLIEKHYPKAEYAVVVIHLRGDLPDVTLTVPPATRPAG